LSGIFGLINLNHAPVEFADLSLMADTLKRRGPDSQTFWQEGAVGLGHALLATTPSALFEPMPFRDSASGCVITADARIDNREELIAALGINIEGKFVGDGELILRAYLKWGNACPEHLLGDFAFALWNPQKRELFCARDQFGMRPFNFYHASDRIFAFASSVPALLALKQIPKKINEARIADFLYDLEAVDTVSTFYENVYRLSPAHSLCVSERKFEVKRYWRLQASGSTLRFSSDAEYVEAFLEVFTTAVKSRLVTADVSKATLGSMLSGGMDSGSVVAIASRILSDQGCPPLKTFSAVGPNPETCGETRSIHAAMGIGGIDPQLVSYSEFSPYLDDIRAVTMQMDEPFDYNMSIIRTIYLTAHLRGVKVLLDGVGGDTVFATGTQIARMIRSGHWVQALSDVFGMKRFHGSAFSVSYALLNAFKTAFAPNFVSKLKRSLSFRQKTMSNNGIIAPSFSRRINLFGRFQQQALHSPNPWLSYAEERAQLICHPFLVVGRERYDRIASAFGIEPRDPFLDRRLIDFCLHLPSRKLQAGGWEKIMLRQAMAEKLPDHVRWKLRREHLGPEFTSKVFHDWTGLNGLSDDDIERLSLYLAPQKISAIRQGMLQKWDYYEIIALAFWLRRVL